MDSPKAKRWRAVDELLDEALQVPPALRATFLSERCGEDLSLRRRVTRLLEAAEKGEGFLETPALGAALQVFDEETTDRLIGATLGSYRLLELVGRGGMGAVYLAARADREFSQRVAVKVVAPFFTGREAEDGFRRERQILARLNHPGIARLLDGGTTEEGVPYLVMEYVEGATITDYCERRALPVKARLRLFLEVCAAVRYAHQNLTIHRDLKPSNILVTTDGTPKLLDFGVAKLLQPELFELTGNFTVGANILTPNYASPEQLKNEAVTTASDVYSLGVILYEMLTGRRPHELKDKSLPEVLRIITEERPAHPSDVARDIGGARADATRPGVENPKALKGDLDNICLKALAKERGERYQTVEALSADITRHLRSQPINARSPTLAYRLKKYVRRHRVGVAALSAILALLLGWLTSALWQRNAALALARGSLRRAYSADMNLAMLAYETANLSELREVLSRYEATEFRRNWEYRFLQNLSRPRGRLLTLTHGAEVWGVAFSPDSKRMATACADGFARVYEVPSGRLLATTAAREKNVWRVKFSPDGSLLATASGDRNSTAAKVWDASSGAELVSLVGHTARVRAIDFSPDGRLLATGSADGTVRIWDAADGRELKRLDVARGRQPREVNDVSFTPDGRRVIVAGYRSSSAWEVEGGRLVSDYATEETPLAVAVSPGGERLAFGKTDSRIVVIAAESGRQLLEIARHEAKVNAVAWSPDGRLVASASSDRTVRFFDANTGTETQSLKTHLNDAWGVAFSPDGRYVATSGTDFDVFLFDAAQLAEASSFGYPPAFGGGWGGISPDRTRVSISNFQLSGRGTIWDIRGKKQLAEFSDSSTRAAAFSPDGKTLATGDGDGSIALRDASDGAVLKSFRAHDEQVTALSFTPDGKRLVSGSWDRAVRVWNPEDGRLVRELCRFENYVSALAISPDGTKVFAASFDTTDALFDFATGEPVARFGRRKKAILSVAFAPDGETFATGDAGGVVEIRRARDGALLDTLTGNAGFIWALTYTPDGSRLASASGEGVIRLWDTETGAQVLSIRTGSAMIVFLAFTPDGNTLVSHGTVEKLKLWEADASAEAPAQK